LRDQGAIAARIERLLGGQSDGDPAGRAAVVLNAAAAIYVAGLVATYAEGITRATAALDSGAGLRALERLRGASASTSG
jgi:anthranilate phosphoribosyltransferase